MRHGKKFNHLGRKVGHRKALLRNLAIALFTHKRINTTLAKAKALRIFAEPLVTKATKNDQHNRRVVFSVLNNKDVIKELFDVIALKVGDRPGGYLRIIKTGFRQGDAAEMAMIEFVDFNETYSPKKDGKAGAGKKRSRRGGKKATTATAPAAPATPAAEEAE